MNAFVYVLNVSVFSPSYLLKTHLSNIIGTKIPVGVSKEIMPRVLQHLLTSRLLNIMCELRIFSPNVSAS